MRSVESGSPADRAGVSPGDVIIRFAMHRIETVSDLHRLLVGEVIGRPVQLALLRSTEWREVDVEPAEMVAR